MARLAPVFATAAAIPVIAGLAAGERASALQLGGMALALAGIALLSRGHAPAPARRRPRAALLAAVVSAACFGLVLVGLDRTAEHDPYWAVLLRRIVSVAVAVAAVLASTSARGPPRGGDSVSLVAAGALKTSALVLFGAASGLGLLSVVSVLASSYPVVTVLLSLVLLDERLDRIQRARAVATIGGSAPLAGG